MKSDSYREREEETKIERVGERKGGRKRKGGGWRERK